MKQETMASLLLIEDDAAYAQVLLRRLESRGWVGQWFSDLTTALSYEGSFNGILLDQNLGGQSSLPKIKALKAKWPNAKLIVVTGYASIATTVSAIKLGADNYLTKPVDISALIRELEGENTDYQTLPSQGVSVDTLEWELIHHTLLSHNNNVSATARALNMHRRTLQRKLQKKRP